MNTLIAYGCFAEALNLWDASKVSAVLALAPLFTIATLKVIVIINPDYAFTDRLSNLSVLGAVLLMVGSALTALMPVCSSAVNRHWRQMMTRCARTEIAIFAAAD